MTGVNRRTHRSSHATKSQRKTVNYFADSHNATAQNWVGVTNLQQPRTNAIAVWGTGLGHVALVAGANGAGITVREMNWGDYPLPGCNDPHSPNYGKWSNWAVEKQNTLSWEKVRNRAGHSFIGYIYPERRLPPGVPGGVSASAVSRTQINVHWNGVTGATGYKVFRWTGGGPWTLVATTGGASFSNTGLRANTYYSYRVRATNAYGESSDSNVASAWTQR